jgi:DNA-directed RNA polymerase specialized sigma24 family protein
MQQFYDLPSSLELSSDLEWMLQSGQVDDATLAVALIREYYSPLMGLFKAVLEDQAAVETCVQQSFAAAVAHRHAYRADMGVRHWFYTQALRIFQKNRWRLQLQQQIKAFPDFFQKSEPAPSVTTKSSDTLWIETFHRLGPENRLMILLHLGAGFTSRELAKIYRQPEEMIQGLIMAHLTYLLFLARKTIGQGKKIQIEHFKEQLGVALHNTQLIHALNEAETYALAASISSPRVQQAQRTSAISFREIALGGGAILVAAFLWIFGGMMDGSLLGEQSQAAVSPTLKLTAFISRTPRLTATVTASPTPENSPTPTVAIIAKANRDPLFDFSKLKSPPIIMTEPHGVSSSGPAALSLVLQTWGWQGDADRPRQMLQPDETDHTVLPYELVDYVNQKTSFKALMRLDGDIGLVCDLATAGYPVIVQRGITTSALDTTTPEIILGAFQAMTVTYATDINPTETGNITTTPTTSDEWFATYEILTDCDERKTEMHVWRPSSNGMARYRVVAWEFDRTWWAFDNQYILVYPQAAEANLMAILAGQGQEYARDNSDEYINFINAVETTSYRVYSASTPLERFFAWFNRGTTLTYLDDYTWATASFDMAFEIYQEIPEQERPWRITWYNTRPYWAYFYTERYQDVIDLATETLASPGGELLEESYYWRALAREASGDLDGALEDMQAAIERNRMFAAGIEQLARMQGQP